jgi:thymidylate synthase ThyX
MITAKIVADSVNADIRQSRITSFVLTYPRFIHSELLTHRALTRNSSSSRAVPINKFIEEVLTDPAMPIHWGANQKGMQADNEVDEETKIKAMQIWHEAKEDAVKHAKRMNEIGIHKQVVNRLMEPFFHMTTLVTATEYSNFFKLRAHSAAQPEIRELAYKMQDALANSIPDRKIEGQWHIPFGDKFVDGLSVEQKLKVATARAARVSYKTFEGEINYDKDYTLHDQLLAEGHYSPFEHSAQAETGVHANFSQWKPYRIIVSSQK